MSERPAALGSVLLCLYVYTRICEADKHALVFYREINTANYYLHTPSNAAAGGRQINQQRVIAH